MAVCVLTAHSAIALDCKKEFKRASRKVTESKKYKGDSSIPFEKRVRRYVSNKIEENAIRPRIVTIGGKKYRLLADFGNGGEADVTLAIDENGNRVAIKEGHGYFTPPDLTETYVALEKMRLAGLPTVQVVDVIREGNRISHLVLDYRTVMSVTEIQNASLFTSSKEERRFEARVDGFRARVRGVLPDLKIPNFPSTTGVLSEIDDPNIFYDSELGDFIILDAQ